MGTAPRVPFATSSASVPSIHYCPEKSFFITSDQDTMLPNPVLFSLVGLCTSSKGVTRSPENQAPSVASVRSIHRLNSRLNRIAARLVGTWRQNRRFQKASEPHRCSPVAAAASAVARSMEKPEITTNHHGSKYPSRQAAATQSTDARGSDRAGREAWAWARPHTQPDRAAGSIVSLRLGTMISPDRASVACRGTIVGASTAPRREVGKILGMSTAGIMGRPAIPVVRPPGVC